MEIKLKRFHGIYIIFIEGELDLYNAPKLETAFTTLVDKGVDSLILDLGRISYIDSSGIGLLLKLNSKAKKEQLGFVLSGVGGEVLHVLQLTNLIDFFPRAKTYREGLESLLNHKKAANG
ncbi:MAG: STAS domain-containing protein [Spirochaetales bacterium]|nr:STAS domain-containing protein [Spirochaetales bacterium]